MFQMYSDKKIMKLLDKSIEMRHLLRLPMRALESSTGHSVALNRVQRRLDPVLMAVVKFF